jgi:hypothetical protein
MNQTKTLFTLILCLANLFVFSQEEQNNEENWMLYPNGEVNTSIDSGGTHGALVLDTLNTDTLSPYSGPAFVEIIQDYRVKQLLEKDKYLNEKNSPPQIEGFRVKIYFGSGANSKNEANQAKAKFLQRFPKEKVYVTWDTPNYTTSIGNYRTKMDAEKFLKEMSVDFPEGFIVPSKIELPALLE